MTENNVKNIAGKTIATQPKPCAKFDDIKKPTAQVNIYPIMKQKNIIK